MFTQEDKMLLEKHKVDSIIITQIKNGVYQSSDAILVSSLQVAKGKDITIVTPSTTAEWWFWIILIFLIVLIIALIIFFIVRRKNNGNMMTDAPTKQSSWVYVG
jgi:ATP-dependent Zn protease